MTEDKMVGWHHWLSGHEFEKTPGDGDGQRSLVCCSLWGHKESDTTERLSNKGLGAQEQKKRGVFMTRVSFSLWGKAKD